MESDLAHTPPSPPSTPLPSAAPVPATRSVFVTVVGWIYLVNASFTTCVLLLQLFLWRYLIGTLEMSSIADQGGEIAKSIAWQRIILQIVLGFLTALSVTMLAASIGLLRRKGGARRLFTWLLVAAIVVTLLGALWMVYEFARASAEAPQYSNLSTERIAETVFALRVMIASNSIFCFVLASMNGWIVHKLHTPPMLKEFGVAT